MANLPETHYYYNGKKPPQDSCPGFDLKQDWMKKIPIGTPICRISIPGTHDSMCYETPTGHVQSPWIQCQNWTLKSQLDAGIRFIDIRFKVESNELFLYHSIYPLGKSLNQNVMEVLKDFLTENPSEFIICRLKDETLLERNKIKDAWDRFVIKWKSLLWKTNGELPLYNAEMNGKVVVLRDKVSETSTSSLYSIKWTDDQLSIVDDFFIQFTPYDVKLEGLTTNIKHLANKDKLKIHFVSGTSFNGPSPIAQEMNKAMCDYLRGEASDDLTDVGVIIMDYPGIGLINDIIDKNKKILKRVDVKEDLKERDTVLLPLESYMQHLPDHMPISLLSLAGKSDPDEIKQLLHNGFRVFRFNQHIDLTTVISEIGKYIETYASESVLVCLSENSSALNQLNCLDYTQHRTVEDIRGKALLLAVNGNGLGDKVAAFEINENNISRIQKHFNQCATYDNCHGSDNKTVITVTDDKNDVMGHFTDRKCHITCGIVVVGQAGEVSDIININSRYPEMVQLTIRSSDMLKEEDITIGQVVEGWNPYKTALNHEVIRPYMEFYINDYEKFIEELHKRSVISYKELAEILKCLLEYNAKYNRKLHVVETIGCIQQSVENHNNGASVNRFIAVLKSYKELQPLAYFLLEWIDECKTAEKKGNTQNSYRIKVNTALDDNKVVEEMRKDPSACEELFQNGVKDLNVNTRCIEFQINVSREEFVHIREMIESKKFEKNFYAWLKKKGFQVNEETKFDIQWSKVGEKDILQLKEEIPSMKKAESLDEWLRQLCVNISESGIRAWRELGQNLGISEKKLDILSVKFTDNSDRCLFMLVDWNEDENNTASVREKITSLSLSLEKCGQKDMADKIKNELVEHGFSDMSLDDTPGKDSFMKKVEFTVRTFLANILNEQVKQTWGFDLNVLLQDVSAGAIMESDSNREDIIKFKAYIYDNIEIIRVPQEIEQLKHRKIEEFEIQLLYKLLKISWQKVQKEDQIQLAGWVSLIVRYNDDIAPKIDHFYKQSRETAAFMHALKCLTHYYASLKHEVTNPQRPASSTDSQQIKGCSKINEELAMEEEITLPEVQISGEKGEELHQLSRELDGRIQELLSIVKPATIVISKSFRFTNVDLTSLIKGQRRLQPSVVFNIACESERMCFMNNSIYIPCPNDDALLIYSLQGECIKHIKLDTITSPQALHLLSEGRLVLAAMSGLYVVDYEGRVMCQIMEGEFTDVHVSGHLMAVIERYTKKGDQRDTGADTHKSERVDRSDRIHILSTTAPYPQFSVGHTRARTVLLSEDASTVCVSDGEDDHITTYSLSGRQISQVGGRGREQPGKLKYPYLCATDSSGQVLICDMGNDRLQLLSAGGEWTVLPGVQVKAPTDAFIKDNYMYVLHGTWGEKISVFKI